MVIALIEKIKKRDGTIVQFDKQKIFDAILKAEKAVGEDNEQDTNILTELVIDRLIEEVKINPRILNVEEIQDIVERILIKQDKENAAKSYILYRKQREEIRKTRSLFLDVNKVMDTYLLQDDWRVKENSNISYSSSGLLMHLSGTLIAHYVLNKIYPPEISQAHSNGDFHIHDLSMGIMGYCAGWSLKQILLEGFNGIPGKMDSIPPKHLNSLIWMMINFVGTLQNEWAGAQAFSSFDTYLAPFVKSDNLSYDEVKQCIQAFVFNMNVPSRWGGQCVSEDTECLTNKGWKKYDQINIKKDKIATFNIKTRKIEYLKPIGVKAYEYNGELIRIWNRTQDHLVTPNHRVVRKLFNSQNFVLEEAEKLIKLKTGILIPNSGITKSKKEIDDALVELIAWLVSEGTFSEDRKRVSIYQSEKNVQNIRRIGACLKKLGFGWDETKRIHGFSKHNIIRFRLNQESSRKIRKFIQSKKIPPFIKNLSEKQIRLFIETYIRGDGHVEKKGRKRIYSKDRDIVDSIQELCSLIGYGTSTNIRKNKIYQINLIRNSLTNVRLSKQNYMGKVWCPTTKNGTFVARRKDVVFITGNTPFSNITLDWVVPEDMKNKKALIGGKEADFTYGDCQKEMDIINKAFIEIMVGGDARGRIFTFPIPTYNITRDFNWDNENANLLFEMASKYGTPYFQNFINSDLNPSDVRSMCCRLQMDMRELRNKTGGLFGSGELTGSLGVVTLNLPRIGYLSKTEDEFFNKLGHLMDLAKESLEIKRKIVQKNIDDGFMPYTKRYLGNLNNHFSTIGIVGMNETLMNFFDKDIQIYTEKGKAFTEKVLDFMRERISKYQEETGHIYNLEATPAEGTSYRLAKIDKEKYPNIITQGKDAPYYTNSTQLPVGYTDDIFEALELQDSLQIKYTGGTVLHGFLGERVSDAETCKQLVKRIAYNFRLPYFTITPTFSICPKHGYIKGEHEYCPRCDEEATIELMAINANKG